MSDNLPPQSNLYGQLTGKKRLAIVLLGAISGAIVAVMFSAFSGHPPPAWEIILGALGGALLGFSASLGEARRKKSPPDQPSSTPRGE
jgi:hypothetical protein